MKKLLTILIICPLFFIASVSNSQNSKFVSSYDGIWEGYAYSTEVPYTIKVEIKNGILSGFVGDTKITGYINADNQLIGDPFYFKTDGAMVRVTAESKFMSPDRIDGIYTSEKSGVFKWTIVKAGIDKPEITISNFQINEKEPWTGKWKVESSSAGRGVWAMKQTGRIVESTADSTYDFRGRVRGNQLKGFLEGGSDQSFTMEMPTDALSFKGTLVIWNRPYQLKGQRIE